MNRGDVQLDFQATEYVVGPIRRVWDSGGMKLPSELRERVQKALLSDTLHQLDERKPRAASQLQGSQIGKCVAAQAFDYFGFPQDGKELSSDARVNFLVGDVCETAIVAMATAAGVPLDFTLEQQIELTIPLDAHHRIIGHPDGLLRPPGVAPHLFECKSMSGFQAEKFKDGIVDSAYWSQVNGYAWAWSQLMDQPIERITFVAFDKEDRRLLEITAPYDAAWFAGDIQRLSAIIRLPDSATVEQIRALREYGPTVNKKGENLLPWQCRYCSHWRSCWGDHDVVMRGQYIEIVGKK